MDFKKVSLLIRGKDLNSYTSRQSKLTKKNTFYFLANGHRVTEFYLDFGSDQPKSQFLQHLSEHFENSWSVQNKVNCYGVYG